MLRLVIFLVTMGFTFGAQTAIAAYTQNICYGLTPLSQRIYHVHMAAFYAFCIITAVVFITLIYSLFRFHQSKSTPPNIFHGNLVIEMLWFSIPFVILIGLAIPATTLITDTQHSTASDTTIKVIGYDNCGN